MTRSRRAQAARTAAALDATAWDSAAGHYCDGPCADVDGHASVHAQHFPLWLGVVPATRVPNVTAALTGQ